MRYTRFKSGVLCSVQGYHAISAANIQELNNQFNRDAIYCDVKHLLSLFSTRNQIYQRNNEESTATVLAELFQLKIVGLFFVWPIYKFDQLNKKQNRQRRRSKTWTLHVTTTLSPTRARGCWSKWKLLLDASLKIIWTSNCRVVVSPLF
jgi:hypothetical protein